MIGKLIYRLLLIFVMFMTIMLLPRVAYDYNPAFYQITMILTFLRVSLLLFLLIEISRLLNDYIIKTKFKAWIKNICLLIYTMVFMLILLEGVFMFVGRSHYAGYTMSAKIWFFRNWKPLNQYGFRDKPVANDKTYNILTLGDSYTAGHGLKNFEERYTNILDQKLSAINPEIQVINLGRNGVDTKAEYNLMESFIKDSGIEPDYIILQYFGNDIEDVAINNGMNFEGFARYSDLKFGVSNLVESSYLLNYLYWLYPHGDMKPYIEFLQEAYADSTIFRRHLDDIDLFIDFTNERDIPLLVLIYPFLQDTQLSQVMFINRLEQYLNTMNIEYIDASVLVSDLPVSERVINNNDAHPGTLTNKRVAEKILEIIQIN